MCIVANERNTIEPEWFMNGFKRFVKSNLNRRCFGMKKTYSMREISELTGVSKTTVQRAIVKNGYSEAFMNGNQKRFSLRVYNALVKELDEKKLNGETKTVQEDKTEKDNKAVIEILNQQLAEKDKQIADLHKLLDQSQQLQIDVQNKLDRIEPPEPKTDDISNVTPVDEQPEPEQKESHQQQNKKHWWQFGR